MLETLTPRLESEHTVYIKRMIFILVGALIHNMICLILFFEDLFRTSLLEFLMLWFVVWLGYLTFFIIIKSGISKMFSDPGLMLPQIYWSVTFVMATVYLTNQLRPVLLMLGLLPIVYGAFHLKRKQLILVTIYALALYSGVIFALMKFHPRIIDFQNELIILSCFGLIAVGSSQVSTELNRVREFLGKKNRELKKALDYISSLSDTDELTGVKNRKFLITFLEQQRLMAERGQYQFSLCLIDIDRFSEVNEKYGESVGDRVIKTLCRELSRKIRKIDVLGRLEGEEFLIIATFSNDEQAKMMAERIQKQIESIDFGRAAPNLKMTASVGITQYHWPETVQDVLARADEALYLAKQKGKNTLIVT